MFKNSIIISFYTGLNILKSNLHLLQSTIDTDTEVIVVNDNPGFSLNVNEFKEINIPIRIIDTEKNGGYSVACNLGAERSTGENLIFMDCDIMPTPGWMSNLINTTESGENYGAVSATILSMETGGVVHWGMGMTHGVDVVKPFRDGPLPEILQTGIHEFSLLTSGCLLVSRQIFKDAGGFEPLLYNGYCDLDLIMKIKQLGYRCVASSEALVYHRGKIAGQTRIASEEDARALFVHRWGKKLPDDGLSLFSMLVKSQKQKPKKGQALLVNYARSLYAPEYHDVFGNTFSLEFISRYDFRSIPEERTILEDHLSWSLITFQFPIIYFCDNFNRLKANRHWFLYRLGKNDFLADRNGNLIQTDSLV